MHTMHACSRSLAQAVSRLKEAHTAKRPAPGQNAAAGAADTAVGAGAASSAVPGGGAFEQLRNTVGVSGPVLQGIAWVLSNLPEDDDEGCNEGTTTKSRNNNRSGSSTAGPAGSGSSGGPSTSTPRSWRTKLVALLRKALPGCGLVEHLACGVLHLLHSPGCSRQDPGEAFTLFLRAYGGFGAFLECSPELWEVGHAALGGLCASYLVTTGGLRLLCTADAGPSYGMLSSWAEAGVLGCWVGEAGGQVGGEDSTRRGGDGGSTPGAALLPLTAMQYALLYQQPTRRVLTSVFERVGRAALASARHAVRTREGLAVISSVAGGDKGAAAGVSSSRNGSDGGSGSTSGIVGACGKDATPAATAAAAATTAAAAATVTAAAASPPVAPRAAVAALGRCRLRQGSS